MKYFNGINDLNELRSKYKALLKKHHPDNGGDTKICAEINREYDEVFNRLKNSAYKSASTEEEKTKAKHEYDSEEDRKLRETLYRILHLNINIEIIGVWIWVDGETYEIRDQLKALGFQWSRARKKWHYSPYKSKGYRRGKKASMDELRGKYGSAKIKTKKEEDENAA